MVARVGIEGSNAQSYARTAIVLHWAIATFIIFNLATGFFLDNVPRVVTGIHISAGITVLALTMVRLVWRLMHKHPADPDSKPWERYLAGTVHFLFYCLMIGLPLSGWALVSANPPNNSPGAAVDAAEHAKAGTMVHRGGPSIWFLFTLPPLSPVQELGREASGLPTQRAAHAQFEELHRIGGWCMLILLFLHVSGALKHQFFDGHETLSRMGIGKRRGAAKNGLQPLR